MEGLAVSICAILVILVALVVFIYLLDKSAKEFEQEVDNYYRNVCRYVEGRPVE